MEVKMNNPVETLEYVGVKMRIGFPANELEKAIEKNSEIYEKHVHINKNSKYAKILKQCGIVGRTDERKVEEYQPISFGIVAYNSYGLEEAISFIESAEILYKEQKTSFVLNHSVLEPIEFLEFQPKEFRIFIFSPGIYYEDFRKYGRTHCREI
ncbi:Uncharacterised protein [uncultured archaeon]|nr:Uncharacterised protein [uncultured archaeon]